MKIKREKQNYQFNKKDIQNSINTAFKQDDKKEFIEIIRLLTKK